MLRFCRLSPVAVCGGVILQGGLLISGEPDENKVRQAVLQRFDENRNDKLESSEARQARERLRNLLEDTSGREINIPTWRDDVQELLQSLDQDGDNRLSASEKDTAVSMLERIVPKVDTSRPKESERPMSGSSGSSTRGAGQDRKRRSSGSGYGSGGGARYGMSMGGGGFGLGNAYVVGDNGTPFRGFGSTFGGVGGVGGGSASGFGGSGGAGAGGSTSGASGGTASGGMSGMEAGQSGSGTGMSGGGGFGGGMTDGTGMMGGMGAMRPGIGDPGMGSQTGSSGMGSNSLAGAGTGNAGQGQSPFNGANGSSSMSSPLEDVPLEDSALGGGSGMPTSPTGPGMSEGSMPSGGMPPTEGLGGLGSSGVGGANGGPEFIPPPVNPNF